MSDTSKTAKIIKRWYHSPSHRLTVAVNKCINWCFVHLYLLFYYNNKVFMLMVNYKPSALHGHEDTEPWIFWGSRFWSLGITWRHWTWHMWFPIGGLLKSCIYLAQLRRYGAPKILGSRPWPFGVTWPSDSAWALSYWWSMMTMRLSCMGTEIRGFKDFGVTSLTKQIHANSEPKKTQHEVILKT